MLHCTVLDKPGTQLPHVEVVSPHGDERYTLQDLKKEWGLTSKERASMVMADPSLFPIESRVSYISKKDSASTAAPPRR